MEFLKRGEREPVAGDLHAEDSGDLPNVGGLSGALLADKRRDRLWILQQPLELVLRPSLGVVAGASGIGSAANSSDCTVTWELEP